MARKTIIAVAALLLAAGFASASVTEQAQSELNHVRDLYRAITSYHALLHGDGVTGDLVNSALFDVEQYVQELDSRLATDKLFIDDQETIEAISEVVAKAHMQAALLHARGVDLEGSIVQYEKVVDLLGYNPIQWDTTLERRGRLGLLAGAREIVFDLGTPREIVKDLQKFWSAGVVTRFEVQEYGASQRRQLALERIGGPNDPFSQAAFELAARRFVERARSGLEEFRVVLPAGRYQVNAAAADHPPREFVVVRGGVPDPIILNPNRFSFAFASPDERCRPQLELNGVPVAGLANLPYGTYRVKAPAGCPVRLPDKITVEQKPEVTLRTEPERLDMVREGQPIFLFITTPPGSTYTLRM